MNQHTFILVSTSLAILLAIWLVVGYFNYIAFFKNIVFYEKEYVKLERLEDTSGSMRKKTEFFLKKREMEEAYPAVHNIYQELTEAKDRQKYLNKTKLKFLFMGPIYNI